MNRVLLLCAIASMILILLIVPYAAPAAASPVPLPAAQVAQDAVIASLDPVQGIVQHQPAGANPQDNAQWRILRTPILVSAGDRVRTNRDGLAYLTFFEGVETQIGPNTVVVISTLDLADVANQNFNISLDVLLGATLTAIDITLDAADRFEVHTPGATAVVRGTTWWTLVHQDGSAEFECVEGDFGIVPHLLPVPPEIDVEPDINDAAAPEAPDGALAAAPAPDPMIAAVWDMWLGFDPGVVSYFGPDGETLTPPDAMRLPPTHGAMPVSATCGDGVCQPLELNTCPLDCVAQIDLSACGNGICEPEANEDLLLCAADCSPYAGAACGNEVCDADESGLTCPADCTPDQYFAPVMNALCGNGTCDITESTLTCPADCVSADQVIPAPDGDAGAAGDGARCVLTAEGANMRTGPDTAFPIVGRLTPGMALYATGISADGLWYASRDAGETVWVAVWVVVATGPCNALRVVEAPPLPAAGPTPVWQAGQWGPCGSCDSCGHPANECMLNPDGQCVWNPTTCGAQ